MKGNDGLWGSLLLLVLLLALLTGLWFALAPIPLW